MKDFEVLQQARSLIADPDHWCQGHNAEDAEGNAVIYSDPKAVRFCVIGALFRVGGPMEVRDLTTASTMLFETPCVNVNDKMGHEAVLQVYDKAIELAKQALELAKQAA